MISISKKFLKLGVCLGFVLCASLTCFATETTYQESANVVKYENSVDYVIDVNWGSHLNVRSGAGTEYSITGTLNRGNKVIGWKEDNGFVYVSSPTLGGWVSKSFLVTGNEATKISSEAPVVSRGSFSRSAVDSSVVDSLTTDIVNLAYAQLGKKYSYATAGPNTFDCSGLTTYVYSSNGISVPRTSRDYINAGVSVSLASIRPGDILCFDTSGAINGVISHVGIYVGDGKLIHAATGSRHYVALDNLSDTYYMTRLVSIRRVY